MRRQAVERGSDRTELTDDLPVDVAVIGAGVTGLTTALLLLREGKSVVVIEGRRIGDGNTGLSTAHLTEALDVRWHEVLSRRGEHVARRIATAQREAIANSRR
jgi:glycine/D-amino acid oxidase-like deaminating enzyme